MALLVQKYGGPSVADAERIRNVARRIAARHRQGDQLVVIVSAMGDTTDRLIALAREITGPPEAREPDPPTAHGRARILSVEPARLQQELERGRVVIVSGFQGISEEMEVTTLGRGASDLTAVALAAALEAERCEIYTDADGVYSADPRLEPSARKLRDVSYEEMLELASLGARVINPRAVDLGAVSGIEILVASSFNDEPA